MAGDKSEKKDKKRKQVEEGVADEDVEMEDGGKVCLSVLELIPLVLINSAVSKKGKKRKNRSGHPP